MRDNVTTYKIWAPDSALWTEWVKPVLFAGSRRAGNFILEIPTINWISEANLNTMVILDLPSKEGVEEGLALAQIGYRPVPLYNGVNGSNTMSMIVNANDIAAALYKGAEELKAFNIRPAAPPAFLLDSNRMKGRGKQPGKYDNRWCVFPQDMPSASFLIKNGIQKIIVRSDEIQNDLSHILCRYQEQGIKIFLCNGGEAFKELTVAKPSQFKSLIYRFKVILGLTRNAAGGFGGEIPEATQVNSGTRYYGRMG